MRLVTGFEIVNHTLSMVLIAARRCRAVAWIAGQVGVGRRGRGHGDGLAPERHLALDHVGDASLFEHIGTVQDGIDTLSRPHTVLDRPDAPPLKVPRGEIRFEHVSFGYGGRRR
jgi:ATP-binding cassette subfamily B multidrug efflux pump